MFRAADAGARFHPACLPDSALATAPRQTRRRVLQLSQRRAVLSEAATAMRLGGDHSGGFSRNATAWVPAWNHCSA